MDADSSYGGSDTTQDNTLSQNCSSLDMTITNSNDSPHDYPSHNDEDKFVKNSTSPKKESNTYYKNEVTLPVNYDDTKKEKSSLPHYLSTANLNIEESLENHNHLDELSKKYSSTHSLHKTETPRSRKKSITGVDNPTFVDDENNHPVTNGALKSTFDNKKPFNNGDLNNTSATPNKGESEMVEAVNLELINLKPNGKDIVGPYENGNGFTDIPIKKETEVEIGNPYDEYFVPVNEHRKYMRYSFFILFPTFLLIFL